MIADVLLIIGSLMYLSVFMTFLCIIDDAVYCGYSNVTGVSTLNYIQLLVITTMFIARVHIEWISAFISVLCITLVSWWIGHSYDDCSSIYALMITMLTFNCAWFLMCLMIWIGSRHKSMKMFALNEKFFGDKYEH